jgi:hypothetical protein
MHIEKIQSLGTSREMFGEAWDAYAESTPAFFPRLGNAGTPMAEGPSTEKLS